ncbi:MAG: hypothetical protein HZB50_05640 [Chloroflexi bacterium]|nr:hypothetical protein [Chloroflexota bacterium]
MPRRSLNRLYKDEFSNYSLATFQNDLIAGGLLIGALGGVPYQISGAKVVTSVVLIVLVNRYGLEVGP